MATCPVNTSHLDRSIQSQNGLRILPYTYLPSVNMLQRLTEHQCVSDSKSDEIAARKRNLANSALSLQLQDAMPWQTVSVSAEPGSDCTVTAAHPSTPEADVSASASDDDLSAYLMSLFVSDRPMITEEQVELERAAMTDDERMEALIDLFGKQCGISAPRG
jgi:hypothetical protein